jgi:CheY-like chemotaxis protein
MAEGLHGLRILLVEDEAMIALDLEFALQAAGYHVVGPVAGLAQAVALLRTEAIDAALLDVNLNGELSFPLAELLAERKIPFVFLTGYAEVVVPKPLRRRPVCRKPCAPHHPLGVLETTVQAGGAA